MPIEVNRALAERPSERMYTVPLIVRGDIIEDDIVRFGGRHGEVSFATPDVHKYVDRLPLHKPSDLQDYYDTSLDEVIKFLGHVGKRLRLENNVPLRDAFELSCLTSGLSRSILLRIYDQDLATLFEPEYLKQVARRTVGIEYLEGWVPHVMLDGRVMSIRAFGARSVHITPGNLPTPAAATLIRNALTRSDAIVKVPSNDPLTAAALALTMIGLDPQHPVTRHFSVAYWKGGDASIEDRLYTPKNIEKIIAWGGFASIRHVTKYLQPGIDLITLDPKLSSTIIGREVFVHDDAMREVARRIAADLGVFNQEACVNARVIYVECGTDDASLERLNRLGHYIYEAVRNLPEHSSTSVARFNQDLRAEVESVRLDDDNYRVIGMDGNEGGIIVSQKSEPVDFASMLSGRVGNLVPVESADVAVAATTAYTQTVGVYPEDLKMRIRDALSLHGAQRIVSLGYATNFGIAGPQDGIEAMRRMCKWIVDDQSEGTAVRKPWL